MPYTAPMLGRRFGRWTVVERVPRPKYYATEAAWYLCRCDCGAEKTVCGASLRNGSSKSCGCLRKEVSSQMMKEMRRKQVNGDIA